MTPSGSVVAASALAALLLTSCRGRPVPGFTATPVGRDAGGDTTDHAPDGAADVAVDSAPEVAIDAPAEVATDAAADAGDAPAPAGQCVNLECRLTTCTTAPRGCGRCPSGAGTLCLIPPCPPGGDAGAPSGCLQQPCPDGTRTTVTGRVFDPAGRVPLYNVLVTVPNAPLDPVGEGPSCPRCDTPVSGRPLTAALTDTDGRFTLQDVPVGDGVPLVIQIGKWRRELTLPSVAACTRTALPEDGSLRLPRNQSEGHLPRIALTTGGGDALECFLRKLGIDDQEFTPESMAGRVNLYRGAGGGDRYAPELNGGAAFTAAPTFWESAVSLRRYDIVVHSCDEIDGVADKSPAARQALQDYADGGGRVFLSHRHASWLEQGPPPWPTVATFDHQGSLPDPFTASVDLTFPKGAALADWLLRNGASGERGVVELREAQHTVAAVTPGVAQRWLGGPSSVQLLTVDTPVGASAVDKCGRIVLGDIHVSSADRSAPDAPFPRGCGTVELSPQEKALEFLLFDQSACVQSDRSK